MASIQELAQRRDELEAELREVREEIASRAGEVDQPTPANPPVTKKPSVNK